MESKNKEIECLELCFELCFEHVWHHFGSYNKSFIDQACLFGQDGGILASFFLTCDQARQSNLGESRGRGVSGVPFHLSPRALVFSVKRKKRKRTPERRLRSFLACLRLWTSTSYQSAINTQKKKNLANIPPYNPYVK